MGKKIIDGTLQYANSNNTYANLSLIPKQYADNILTTAKAYTDTKVASIPTATSFVSFYQYQIEGLGNLEVFTRVSRSGGDTCDILIHNDDTGIDEYYGIGSNDETDISGIVVKSGTTQLFKIIADNTALDKLILTPYLPIVYRHSVSIIGKISDTERFCFCFTVDHSKNTPIDSVQDLTTMLGNTIIMGSGANSTNTTFYQKLEIGASISNTLLYSLSSGTSLLLSTTTFVALEDDVSVINFNAQ